KGSPFYAKVEKEVINTYSEAVSGNGAAWELYKGMVDNVTAISEGFVRLSLGQWVKESDVSVYTSQAQARPVVRSVFYTAGEWWDSLKLGIRNSVAATADFDGERLTLKITAGSTAAMPKLPSSSPFSAVTVTKDGSNSVYTLTIKKGQEIGGFYVQNTAEGLVLNIKRPLKSNGSSKPLSGMTIMLDPGHGGTDTGATGPLGAGYSEKDINLATALKLRSELEKLGAKVTMTRSTDINVSLEERLAVSRNSKPDMFISLHANSMEDNVDISRVDGFAVFYREKLAQSLAAAVFENTVATLGRTNKGLHNNNFYVTRGTWAPSILVESGFVPNPYEFEWLTGEAGQTALAKSLSQAVVRYFE
ncbi:MAG: N-acetylmuramoyl-L-alanine amidase family protein, partial [Pseudomonadota bacterium]